jgi:nitrogen fixation-related uncharacterized protein
VRRKPSARATVLLGYIPTSKLKECYSVDKERQLAIHQLFHDCMRMMLAPLVTAGKDGEKMVCSDGYIRHVYPIVAAYIADYPEQCLVVACKENACPTCLVNPKERGNTTRAPLRQAKDTRRVLSEQSRGLKPPEFQQHNLRPLNPFWTDLPYCDIHTCITPDLLHQLHKGVFGDHVAEWTVEAMRNGKKELDQRYKAMPRHPKLRHFKNGVSHTTQWTGKEYKAMEKVFVGAIAGGVDDKIVDAARGLVDFIHYAHFETHTDESLGALDHSWSAFHANKDIFKTVGPLREHFNINKLHNIRHYVDAVKSRGTTDGYNTENSERLHIDHAKKAYASSNFNDYTAQMTTWFTRQESVAQFDSYLWWAVHGSQFDDDEDAGEGQDGNDSTADDLDTGGAAAGEDDIEAIASGQDESMERQSTTFKIAKTPPYPSTSVATLIQEYDTHDFLYYLEGFIRDHQVSLKQELTEQIRYPVYKQVTLTLPPVPYAESETQKDVIRATRAEDTTRTQKGGIKKARPAETSTVLVRVDKSRGNEGDLLNGKAVLSEL